VTAAKPELVRDALRDVGALHTRLAPGFVTHTRLEPGARIVTFGNGMVVREAIITRRCRTPPRLVGVPRHAHPSQRIRAGSARRGRHDQGGLDHRFPTPLRMRSAR